MLFWKKICRFVTITLFLGQEAECGLVEVGKEKRYLKVMCGSKYKCPRSDVLYSVEEYRDNPEWNLWALDSCEHKYDTVCPEDNMFYQVCGHEKSECLGSNDRDMQTSFCGSYPCKFKNQTFPYARTGISFGTNIISGQVNTMYANCDGQLTCSNTEVDEFGCLDPESDQVYTCKGEITSVIPASKVCDLQCDCYRCNDEAVCNNSTYGVNCKSTYGDHIHAMYNCDNWDHCDEKEDEALCAPENILRYCIPGDLHGPDIA